MARYSKEDRADAIEHLRMELEPGDTVHTILRHVTRSGMSRSISVVSLKSGGSSYDVTWLAARALDESIDQRHDGLRIGGCGMDMGFHVVYNLSRTLFPEGFECVGDKCPSNDHSNGDRDYSPHHHNDGGYALKQRWL